MHGSGWREPGYRCAAQHLTVPADALEERVLAYILGRLSRKDVYRKLRRAGQGANRERAAAQAEADRLRERLDEARESAAKPDGISYAALAVQERELGRAIAAADKRADEVGVSPAVRDLVDSDDMPATWGAMPVAAQRDVARELVTVTVARATRGRWTPIAERVTIAWKGTG